MDNLTVLRKARSIIADKENWTQGTERDTVITFSEKHKFRYCASGAVRQAIFGEDFNNSRGLDYNNPLRVQSRRVMSSLGLAAHAVDPVSGDSIINLNDAYKSDKSHAKVLKAFDLAIQDEERNARR